MLEKGTIISGYRVDGILGEGGMSIVYRATQLSLNRTVALKILASDLSQDGAFRERFRREGLVQAAIDHQHIVTVYEAGDTGDGLFLAMRLIRGPTLKDAILARELDPGRALRILSQMAGALDTAHEAGLTHRDVKPQNILIGPDDHAYLADFGLTKAANEVSLTKTGQFIGTIDYVAPEQIQGEPATARSDVYSLTAVLYEALTGVVPYAKPNEPAVLYAHISEPPPRVTEHRSDLPQRFDEVIARGMAKLPADRYTSAGELIADALDAFGTGPSAVTAPGPLESAEETGLRISASEQTVTRATRGATGAKAYPLGPSAAYASRLREVIQSLDAARRSETEGLRQADTPEAQAAAAEALASAYRRAARALAATEVSPTDAAANRALSGALERTASAYAQAAEAARAGDNDAYSAADRAVQAGQTALRRALTGLERPG